MDELLDSLMAPSFFYDLSADAMAGTGAGTGLDDSFFDVEHPLHESGWPLEPPRALIVGSPGGAASPYEVDFMTSHVSPARGGTDPGPPPEPPPAVEQSACTPSANAGGAAAPASCATSTLSRAPAVRTQKRSTGAAGLQTPVERQAERAMRGRRIESPGAVRHRAAASRPVAVPPVVGGASACASAPGVDVDRETRNLLAELEMHNKKIVEAGRLAARDRVKHAGGGAAAAAARTPCAAGSAARAAKTARPVSASTGPAGDRSRSPSAPAPPPPPPPVEAPPYAGPSAALSSAEEQPTPTLAVNLSIGTGWLEIQNMTHGPKLQAVRVETLVEPALAAASGNLRIASPPYPEEAMDLDDGADEVLSSAGATASSQPPPPPQGPPSPRPPADTFPNALAAGAAPATIGRGSTAVDTPGGPVLAAPPPAAAPPEFVCPITRALMKDPVSTIDGQVFERAAIERWFRRHKTNPLTGQPVDSTVLVPNLPLASLIATHIARGGEENSATAACVEPGANGLQLAAALPLPGGKAVQFSDDSGAGPSSTCLSGGRTTRARRNGGSSTGGGGLVGGTGGTGRARSHGRVSAEHTPTASTRPVPAAASGPLQHTDLAEPPPPAYCGSEARASGAAADEDEGGKGAKAEASSGLALHESDARRQRVLVFEDGSANCKPAVAPPSPAAGARGHVLVVGWGCGSGQPPARPGASEVPVAHVQLDVNSSGGSSAAQSRREELEAWRRDREAKRQLERLGREGGRAATSALHVIEQHNARINKKGVASAQQRLKAHRTVVAKPAAAAHFYAAAEAVSRGGAARALAAPAEIQTDEQLLALLQKHNAKVGVEPPKRLHESSKASVAAMRAWEARTGRTYASLSYDERAAANNNILAWQTGQHAAAM